MALQRHSIWLMYQYTGGSKGGGENVFSIFICSREILSLILIEIRPKHAKTWHLLQPSTLSMIVFPNPRVDKVHAPPPAPPLGQILDPSLYGMPTGVDQIPAWRCFSYSVSSAKFLWLTTSLHSGLNPLLLSFSSNPQWGAFCFLGDRR